MQAYGPRGEYRSSLLAQLPDRCRLGGALEPRRWCRGYDLHECRNGRCSPDSRAANNFVPGGIAVEELRHVASVNCHVLEVAVCKDRHYVGRKRTVMRAGATRMRSGAGGKTEGFLRLHKGHPVGRGDAGK